MEYINPFKLLEHIDTIYWIEDGLTINEIEELLYCYPIQTKECNPYKAEEYSKEWHIGRVRFFVENPNTIDAIEIFEGDIPLGIIYDGNHRYVASIILKQKQLPCIYNGSEEFLNQLKGE